MSAQIIPFQYHSTHVRAIADDKGEPWFVAADVCAALSIRTEQIRRLDDDEKGLRLIQTLGGEQEMSVINESGLYHLIMTSRKAEAKQFRKWVTSEVLPAIRKTGKYEATITPAQQLQIRRAVSKVAKGSPENFSKVYHRLYDAFAIGKYEQLPAARFDEAVEFLAALEGEFLPKPEPVNALHQMPDREQLLKDAIAAHLGELRMMLTINLESKPALSLIEPNEIVLSAEKLPDLILHSNGQIPKALLPRIIEAAAKRLLSGI